jgi:hypothetical protein
LTDLNNVQMKPSGITALDVSLFKIVRPPVKSLHESETTGREMQVPAKFGASQSVIVGVAACSKIEADFRYKQV